MMAGKSMPHSRCCGACGTRLGFEVQAKQLRNRIDLYGWAAPTVSAIFAARAPIGFGAHTMYYSPMFDVLPPRAMNLTERQTAFESFIDYALSKPDVRIVSLQELLDWMRNPQPL